MEILQIRTEYERGAGSWPGQSQPGCRNRGELGKRRKSLNFLKFLRQNADGRMSVELTILPGMPAMIAWFRGNRMHPRRASRRQPDVSRYQSFETRRPYGSYARRVGNAPADPALETLGIGTADAKR